MNLENYNWPENAPETNAEFRAYPQISNDHFAYRMVKITHAWRLETQRDEARRELENERKSVEALGRSFDSMRAAHSDLTRQITELEGFNTAACDANRKLEEQAERMEHELATLRRQSAATTEQLDQLRESYRILCRERDQASSQSAALQERNTQLEGALKEHDRLLRLANRYIWNSPLENALPLHDEIEGQLNLVESQSLLALRSTSST